MVYILFAKLDTLNSDTFYKENIDKLPVDMQMKNMRLYKREDRIANLAGISLLIKGMDKFKQGIHCLHTITYNKFNRPSFSINNNIDFNISHSGSCVVCALSDKTKLGIDIELVQNICLNDFTNVMTEDEMANIRNSKKLLYTFYEYWTKKESVLKAEGCGFTNDLNKKLRINENHGVLNDKEWRLQKINIDDKYVINLATEKELYIQIEEIEL